MLISNSNIIQIQIMRDKQQIKRIFLQKKKRIKKFQNPIKNYPQVK